MSLASQIEYVNRKLAKYQGKINEVKEEGRYTRDACKVEDSIARVWKLQCKARHVVKKLAITDRSPEITKAYLEVYKSGEDVVKNLLDFRTELMLANVTSGLSATPIKRASK